MSWWEALILGLVQGLTEFLPVSSSGHLEIGQALLGTAGEENLTFAIVVHAATVLSTLVILWKEVAQLFKGTFTDVMKNFFLIKAVILFCCKMDQLEQKIVNVKVYRITNRTHAFHFFIEFFH